MKRLLLTAALAGMLVVPAASHATTTKTASCRGIMEEAATTGDCSTTFDLSGADVFISTLSRGSFVSPTAIGPVTLTWTDAVGDVVAVLDCTAVGTTAAFGVDATHVCQTTSSKAQYAAGTQTLSVHAEDIAPESATATFEGVLVLKDPADPTDPI